MKNQSLFLARSWSNDRKNYKLGYINTLGQWAIEPEYEKANEFHDGFAKVEKDNKTFIINEKNRKDIRSPNHNTFRTISRRSCNCLYRRKTR